MEGILRHEEDRILFLAGRLFDRTRLIRHMVKQRIEVARQELYGMRGGSKSNKKPSRSRLRLQAELQSFRDEILESSQREHDRCLGRNDGHG